MKRRSLIACIAVAAILIIAGGCFYYYYYNYIETVNNYFLIKYTPPQLEESLFGGTEFSEPKLEILQLKEYPDDETAVKEQTQDAQSLYSYVLGEFEKHSASSNGDIAEMAQRSAQTELLAEERVVVRTTHVRKFTPEEALRMIKAHWSDQSLEDYAKSNKIEVAVYPIQKVK